MVAMGRRGAGWVMTPLSAQVQLGVKRSAPGLTLKKTPYVSRYLIGPDGGQVYSFLSHILAKTYGRSRPTPLTRWLTGCWR